MINPKIVIDLTIPTNFCPTFSYPNLEVFSVFGDSLSDTSGYLPWVGLTKLIPFSFHHHSSLRLWFLLAGRGQIWSIWDLRSQVLLHPSYMSTPVWTHSTTFPILRLKYLFAQNRKKMGIINLELMTNAQVYVTAKHLGENL